MAAYEEHWQSMIRILQDAEKRRVSIEIIKDDADEPWEVHISEANVMESLDIDKGPICICYKCDLLPVALGTAWLMFNNARNKIT